MYTTNFETETEKYAMYVPRHKRQDFGRTGKDESDASSEQDQAAMIKEQAQLQYRPSRKLKDLVDYMESTEGSLEALREENAKLKLKVLKTMMGSVSMGKLAATGMGDPLMLRTFFDRWQAIREDLRAGRTIEDLKRKVLLKKQTVFARMFGGQTKDTLKHCFLGWYNSLQVLKDERQVLDELSAHRVGRGQLIEKYHELENDFVNERTKGQELESSLQETIEAIEHFQKDVRFSRERLDDLNQELEVQKRTSQDLNDTLDSHRERQTKLRREIQSQQEKINKQQMDLEQEEREKRDLSERLVAAEQGVDGLRLEKERGVSKLQRYEALAQEKDERIQALQIQLEEAHRCIGSLKSGAQQYLGEHTQPGKPSKSKSDFDVMRDKITNLMDKMDWKDHVAHMPSPPQATSKPDLEAIKMGAVPSGIYHGVPQQSSPSKIQKSSVLLPSGPPDSVYQQSTVLLPSGPPPGPPGFGVPVTLGEAENQQRGLLQPMGQPMQLMQPIMQPQMGGHQIPIGSPPPWAYAQA